MCCHKELQIENTWLYKLAYIALLSVRHSLAVDRIAEQLFTRKPGLYYLGHFCILFARFVTISALILLQCVCVVRILSISYRHVKPKRGRGKDGALVPREAAVRR